MKIVIFSQKSGNLFEEKTLYIFSLHYDLSNVWQIGI